MTDKEIDQIANALHNLHSDGGVNWLGWLGMAVAIFAVWVAHRQLEKISEQILKSVEENKQQHDLIRRQNSVNIIQYYVQNSKPEHNKMKNFLECLGESEIRRLYEGKIIKVDKDIKNVAFSALRNEFPKIEDRYKESSKACSLSYAESMHLRFTMLDLLNHIEACLLPWHLGIADENIIIQQFSPLIAKKEGKYRLADARRIVGEEKFPATVAFINCIDARSSQPEPREQLAK